MESYFKASVAFRLRFLDWKEHYRFLLDPSQAMALICQGLFKAVDLSLPLYLPAGHISILCTYQLPQSIFIANRKPLPFHICVHLDKYPKDTEGLNVFCNGIWIPSASVNFHNCPLFQHHLKALRCPITKFKNQIYSSETKENLLNKCVKIQNSTQTTVSMFSPSFFLWCLCYHG